MTHCFFRVYFLTSGWSQVFCHPSGLGGQDLLLNEKSTQMLTVTMAGIGTPVFSFPALALNRKLMRRQTLCCDFSIAFPITAT